MTEKEIAAMIEKWLRNEGDPENYCGFDLNTEKLAKMKQMQELCAEIAELDGDVRCTFPTFDMTKRNASMYLDFPSFYFSGDRRISDRLSRLYSLSDHFSIASKARDNGIRLAFNISDMWRLHGSIADFRK